jgi:hypothetical protein
VLDIYAQKQFIDMSKIPDIFAQKNELVVVAPSDEYHNGRLIVRKEVADKILAHKSVKIPGITDAKLCVHTSLTQVVPNQLSLWISSNHFPNHELCVLNIGTRWEENQTKTTNKEVIQLSQKLSQIVGNEYKIEF